VGVDSAGGPVTLNAVKGAIPSMAPFAALRVTMLPLRSAGEGVRGGKQRVQIAAGVG
jgi:hypothetical protein